MEKNLKLTDSIRFFSHFELGYTNYLRAQKHDIVLLHTAQRRSYEKLGIDLKPILFRAIQESRNNIDTNVKILK